MDKINVSRIQDHLRCGLYAHNKWRLGALPVFEGAPLQIGKAWHAAMEVLAKGGTAEEASAAAALVLLEVDHTQLTEKKIEEFIDQSELIHFLIPHVSFPPEWEILQVEQELTMQIGAAGGKTFTLRGRPDAVVRWNGKLWHVQHKTTNKSVSWPLYERAIARSFHEAAYLTMLEVNAPYPEPVAGTILLGMRKLSLSSAKKDPASCLHRAFIPSSRESRHGAMKTIGILGDWLLKEDLLFDADIPLVLTENRESCLGTTKNMPCQYLEVCDGFRKLDDPAYFRQVDLNEMYAPAPGAGEAE